MHLRSPALPLGVLLLGTAGAPAVTRQEAGCDLVITHVTVVDVEAGRRLRDRTVVVCGRHIRSIDMDASGIGGRTQQVDGRGRFLVPGLWDAHAHALSVDFAGWAAPLLLANGVTAVRDMGFFPDTGAAARRDIAAGRVVGPRLLVSLRLDGPVNRAPWVHRAATEAAGAQAVREARRAGMDFVKVYTNLPREAYYGATREARRIGMPVDGHVPYAVSMEEAIAAGQRTMEHEDDLMRACTKGYDSLRAALAAPRRDRRSNAELLEVRAMGRLMRTRPDAPHCASVTASLARSRVALVPTLVVYQPYAHRRSAGIVHPERDRYVPAALRKSWVQRLAQVTDADTAVAASFYSEPRTLALQRAGVRLLAGTDTPLPYLVPGFSLHDELRLLRRAGLTPLQVLRSATILPAQVFGLRDSLGTVVPGQLADLVLLDADPLEDPTNLSQIRAVIANGHLFDRAALDSLLARAARRAARD